jgi:hypothetical protein
MADVEGVPAVMSISFDDYRSPAHGQVQPWARYVRSPRRLSDPLERQGTGDRALGRLSSWDRSRSIDPARTATLSPGGNGRQKAELRIAGSVAHRTDQWGVEVTNAEGLTQSVGDLGFQTPLGTLQFKGVQIEPLAAADFPSSARRLGGTVGDIKVVTSVHRDHDAAAMAAAGAAPSSITGRIADRRCGAPRQISRRPSIDFDIVNSSV